MVSKINVNLLPPKTNNFQVGMARTAQEAKFQVGAFNLHYKKRKKVI
jgi:hypothetical protein